MSKDVFFTKFSELSGQRLDPLYYKVDKKYNLKTVKLKTLLLDVFQGQAQGSEKEDNIKILKVKNLDLFGNIDFKDVTYINTVSIKKILQYGDIITPFRGQTIFTKKFAFFDSKERVTIDNNLGVIRLDNTKILPKYFYYYISSNIGFQEILKNLGGASIPALTKDIIYNLDIYIPDIKIQNEIISIMENSNKLKQEKEKKSQNKLDSINDYLLSELTTLNQLNNDSKKELEDRVFISKFSSVSGFRLDPLYYSGEITGFFQTIKFPFKSLSFFIKHIDSGIGAGKEEQLCKEDGLLQLRPTNFNKYGQLIFRKNIFVKKDSKYPKVDINDVLFNNTNSQDLVGKTTIVLNKLDASFSNHITRIKVNEKINPSFLWIILNLYQKQKIFYNLCTNWNNQSGVGLDTLKDLKIPVLSIDNQEKIVNKIQSLHKESKELILEANAIFEDSKKEVENIILGSTL